MGRALVVNESIVIPGRELVVSHARSAGPGGQNVNKVNTKAVVRWRVGDSKALADDAKRRFLTKYAARINAGGELVLSADEHREQSRNLAACHERLVKMVRSILQAPRRRVKTKPSQASIKRRLEKKQRTGQKKENRRFQVDGD